MKRIKTIGIALVTTTVVTFSSGLAKADGLSMTNETVLSSDVTFDVASLPKPSGLSSPVPRRVLTHSDGSLFVLAYDGTDTYTPYIYYFDPTVSDPTVTSISTSDLTYDSNALWTIGDIAFTGDYYLLGCNSTSVGVSGNSNTLSDFYLYAWEPTLTSSASGYESTTLRTVASVSKSTSYTAYVGDNNSNCIGSTLAAVGNYVPTDYSSTNYNNYLVFFDTHAGKNWTDSYVMGIVVWQFRKTSSSTTTYDNWYKAYSKSSNLYASTLGNDRSRLEVLPTSNSTIMTNNYLTTTDDFTVTLDGTAQYMYDLEISNATSSTSTGGTAISTTASFSQNFKSVSAASYGGTYFSYGSNYYLVTPVATSTDSGYNISVALYNITNGLSSASSLGQTGTIITSASSDVPYMSAHAVVDSEGGLVIYLVVDDQLATIPGSSSSDSGSTDDDDSIEDDDSTGDSDTGSTVESTSGKSISSSWSSMDLTTNSSWANNNTTSTTQGIRRVLYNEDFDKIYVLAYGDGTINEGETSIYPYLYEVTPPTVTGGEDWTVSSLELTNSSSNGVTQVNTGYWSSTTQTAPNWWLSDIAFTDDNYLIGTNSVLIRGSGSTAVNGDFYMWSWAPESNSLTSSSPVNIYTMKGDTDTSTSTSSNDSKADIYAAGGTNSRLMSNSFTVDGAYSNFWYYFDSHAGNSWSSTYYTKYYMMWNVSVSDDVATRESYYRSCASGYTNETYGQDAMMTLSPFTSATSLKDQIVVDGSGAYATDFILRTNTTSQNATSDSSTYTYITTVSTFNEVDTTVKGTTFYTNRDYSYLVTPTYTTITTTDDDGNETTTYSFGVSVYQLGTTIADATLKWSDTDVISYTTDTDITDIYMTAFVDLGAVSTVYLIVDDMIAYQEVAKSSLVTYEEASRRIFAYNANMYYDYSTDTKYQETGDTDEITGDGNYVIEFDTNIAAEEAYVTLTGVRATSETTSDAIIKEAVLSSTSSSDYHYTITISPSDVIAGAVYSYEVTVLAGDISAFKLSAKGGTTSSSDSSGDTDLQFAYPISVGVDANPSSPYFGNVYVGSSQTDTSSTYVTGGTAGIYVLDPQDDLWNLGVGDDNEPSKDSGSNYNPYNTGATWTGLSASGPRYIAVADDGDVFTCDWGTATSSGNVEGEEVANSGIYYFNPGTGTTSAVYDYDACYTTTGNYLSTVNSKYGTSFETNVVDATSSYRKSFFFDYDSDGNYTYIGGGAASVAVRGSGSDRYLLAIDESHAYMTSSVYSTRNTKANYQHYALNRYNIGTNYTWDTAPSNTYKDLASGVGVGWCTIAPISRGVWVGQHRDRMCNYEHVPMMMYYSDGDEAIVWTSYDELGITILSSSDDISYTDDTDTRGQSDTDLEEFSETRGDSAYDADDNEYYWDSDNSWRGGFAVFEESETSGIIAQSFNRRRGTSTSNTTITYGIRLMRYTLPEEGSTTAQTASTHTEKCFSDDKNVYGKPTVTAYTDDAITYFYNIESDFGQYYITQMAFDYVGNLYLVSYQAKKVAVFTLPTTGSGAITGIARGACYTNSNGLTTTVSLTGNAVSITGGDLIGYSSDERTTSVEEVEEEIDIASGVAETKIFPNPATSYVTVVSDQAINTIEVYSMGSGSLVRSATGAGNLSVTVDIDGLAAGMYIVKVNGLSSHKLIKK